MAPRSLDEVVVGESLPTHSAELLVLDDGTYEVVLRLTPPEEEWETGSYPPPDIDVRKFENAVEAKVWFKQVKRMLLTMGPVYVSPASRLGAGT
ncbi:hypothetical protein MBRA_03804 [Methylobacterium brachiatum]|nr:hypothetical protein MBRA_03804 [Methylobacterium brachiatum]